MQCLYCGTPLAPLRRLTHGDYCSDDHQLFHFAESTDSDCLFRLQPSLPTGWEVQPALVPAPEQSTLQPFLPILDDGPPETPFAPPLSGLIPLWTSFRLPAKPDPEQEGWARNVEPSPSMVRAEFPDMPAAPATSVFEAARDQKRKFASQPPLVRVWHSSPRDLKLMTLAVPILVAVLFDSAAPKIRPDHPDQSVQSRVSAQWNEVRESIRSRAGIEYQDDFRSGLDAWDSHANLARSWSYDAAGFVRPGALALFRPSLPLSDYRVDFLGQIESRAVGLAYRAADFKNYYAIKLVVAHPGPLPIINLVRYAVVDGRVQRVLTKPLPITIRDGSLYHVSLEARGSDFTLITQGQIADYWSDGRFKRGGVGFFCGKGERARIRWVQITHQNDVLGRVCSLLVFDDGHNADRLEH
jgi:hypothetical protein